MKDLITALESMNVLNSWVRSTGTNRPRKAVYWLKGKYAIRDAIMAGLCPKMRVVQSVVKCNRCVKGVYFDWNGDPRGSCYHCNGRGVASLKFVETTMELPWEPVSNGIELVAVKPPKQIVWHTPLNYNSWPGWPMGDLTPHTIDDWTPGKEGIDLPLEEAVRHLNVVEGYWTQWDTEKPYEHSWDEYDSTRYYTFNYRLTLPPFGSDVCFRCNNPKHWSTTVTFPPGLETTWPTCEACGKDPKIYDEIKAIPLPELSPELKIWYDRHMIAFTDVWERHWHNTVEEWQLNRRRATEPKPAGLFRVP